jgi:DNA-binding GntR family transcriptional regulator
MPQRKLDVRDTVADDLRARIGRAEYTHGALLPTVRELADHYRCAPRTAQEALRILAGQGLVTIRPRQGTVVAIAERSIAGPEERLRRSRTGGLFREGETQEIVRCYLTQGHPDARSAFAVFEDEEVGAREYLVRDATGRVVTYATSFVPPDVWSGIAEVREPQPIPDGIIGAVRRVLGYDTVVVPKRKADFARDEEAAALGIEEGEPVLVEVTECQTRDGAVVEYNVSVHPRGYWIGS